MTFVTILGVATAIFLIYKLLTALYLIFYPHVFAKILGHTIDVKTFGKWAVVTGATDGIGKGYAKALAKRGVNVYLVSRSEERLKTTADEIRKINPNVQIKTLSIDFKTATPEFFRTTVANAFKDIEIGMLVNNVGMAYVYPEYVQKLKDGEEFFQDIALVNDVSAMQMTRVVLPAMLKRRKGAVINISSAAAFYPIPLFTVYSASKIFLDYFTRAVSAENADSGVIFQLVHPFYVVTKMSGLRRSNFFAPDPDDYAASALDTVGLVDATSGCFSHEVQRIGMKLFISIVPEKILGPRMMKNMTMVQEKYLRAQEKENKAK